MLMYQKRMNAEKNANVPYTRHMISVQIVRAINDDNPYQIIAHRKTTQKYRATIPLKMTKFLVEKLWLHAIKISSSFGGKYFTIGPDGTRNDSQLVACDK